MTAPRFEDTCALIAAAGSGTRLGMGPKLFVKLGDRILLSHTIDSVRPLVSNVVAAVPPGCLSRTRESLADIPDIHLVEGGATRMESYRLAFECSNADYLVIRDISRPLASMSLAAKTIRAAHRTKAATACVYSDVPLARIHKDVLVESLARNEVVIPSNPQCYHRSILEKVFNTSEVGNEQSPTFWETCIQLNIPVTPVPGERRNIKITTREDLEFAQFLLNKT